VVWSCVAQQPSHEAAVIRFAERFFVVHCGDWGLGTGDWGLGTGDWESRSRIITRRRISPVTCNWQFPSP
jgi:hypothetical protein